MNNDPLLNPYKIKNLEIKIFRLCSGVKGMSGKEQDEILNLIKKDKKLTIILN